MRRDISSVMGKTDIYLSIVSCALHPEKAFPPEVAQIDWDDFYQFCKHQSVAGLVFAVLSRMKTAGVSIDRKVFLRWFSLAEKIEKRNQVLDKRSVQISAFFSKAGLPNCILKGQGNAQMYPIPGLRTSGDIDIWVDGDRETITRLVKNYAPKAFEQYHHIDFPVFRDAPVEVHYTPGKALSPFVNKRLQAYFSSAKEAQMTHKISLPGDVGDIRVPTDEFNMLYQMVHMMNHFFIEGVGLRHFVDYFYLSKKAGRQFAQAGGAQLIERFGMARFARGVLWIERDVLGLPEECLFATPEEAVGRVLLDEMLAGGNFGHYDERYAVRNKGYLARGAVDAYRLMKLSGKFPMESMWKIWRKMENQRWKFKS